MKLNNSLYSHKDVELEIPRRKVGKIGPSLKVSTYRKAEATNPKYSCAGLVFDKLLRYPGTISMYTSKTGMIYVEFENRGETFKAILNDKVCRFNKTSYSHESAREVCLPFVLQRAFENPEMKGVLDSALASKDISSADILLFCDSFYYEFAKDTEVDVRFDLEDAEIEAFFRSGDFARCKEDGFGKSSFEAEKKETKSQASKKDGDFFTDCKAGKYIIPFKWTEEQEKHITKMSFLDNFVPTPEFKILVKKIKYRATKVLEEMDEGVALQDIRQMINAMLLGKPGTGKSTIMYAVSAATGIPVYTIAFNKNTDESVVEGKTAIVKGKPEYVETDIPKFWDKGGIFLLEEPNLADPSITMGVLGQALEYPYVIFKNGYEEVKRHPLSIVVACENVGIAGTRENSPAFSNRFQLKCPMDDPTKETFIDIMVKKSGQKKALCNWVYSIYERTQQYLTSPDVSEDEVLNVLSLRTCLGLLEAYEEGVDLLEAIKISFVGAVAEKDLDLSRRYYAEVIESMPMPKL